jgi:LPXTG-site transpeptidase (sortase) family protein
MKHIIFTEKELEGVFSGKRAKKERSKYWNLLKTFGLFIGITAVIFVGFNYQELYKNLDYWYKTNYKNTDQAATMQTDPTQDILNKLGQQGNLKEALPALPEISDSSMTIPSINVTTPIIWNIPNTPEATLSNLKNGVIHISGTALPGQKGNVFISGHSSNYPWIRSDYNNIFALLNKMVIGDMVHLKYQQKDYLYKISEIKIVKPDDASVMQSTNSSILSLMTCTPVGTNLKRLVVIGSQVYPDAAQNTKTGTKNNLTMPKKVR